MSQFGAWESGRQGLVTSSKTNPRLGDLWYLTIAPDFFNREQSRANSANPSKLVALTRALTRGCLHFPNHIPCALHARDILSNTLLLIRV